MKYTFEFLQETADLARFLLFQNYCEIQKFKEENSTFDPFHESGNHTFWKYQQENKIKEKVINADIYIHAWNKCDFARCEKMLDEGLTTETKQQ